MNTNHSELGNLLNQNSLTLSVGGDIRMLIAGPCISSFLFNVTALNISLERWWEKEMDSELGPLSVWSVHGPRMSACVFSKDSGFSYPKDVYFRWLMLSTLSHMTEWVCDMPCRRRMSCPGWVPTLSPEHQDGLLPPDTLTWDK